MGYGKVAANVARGRQRGEAQERARRDPQEEKRKKEQEEIRKRMEEVDRKAAAERELCHVHMPLQLVVYVFS